MVRSRNIPSFLDHFPAQVWNVHHRYHTTISWFLSSPDWKVAFYGPVSVVFVRKEITLPKGLPRRAEGLGEIKNLGQALLAFDFETKILNYDGARKTLD